MTPRESLQELYIERSEYITKGLIALLIIGNVLMWFQVLSNLRRNGVFTEHQLTEILVIVAAVVTVGSFIFIVRWSIGRPKA